MIGIVKKYRIAALCVSALLTGFTLLFPSIGILQWVSMIPVGMVLFSLADDPPMKRGKVDIKRFYLYGLVFFMVYYLVVFHWFLYMYPMEFTGMSPFEALIVVVVAWIGLSAFQTVGGALVFLTYGITSRGRMLKKYPLLKPVALTVIWVIYEWSQTFGWWGVPWGRLPLGQSKMLFTLQSASLFGSYFVTFLLLTVNFLIAYILLYKEKVKVLSAVSAGLFLVNATFGVIRISAFSDKGTPIRAAAIQGNVSSQDKWDETKVDKMFDVYEKYSVIASENDKAEFILWPETALPYDFFGNGVVSKRIIPYTKNIARTTNATVFVSAFTQFDGESRTPVSNDGSVLYNSVIQVKPTGDIGDVIYAKQHLVPFGEFVPWRTAIMLIIPPLANLGMIENDIAKGRGVSLMETDKAVVGCGVCFDSIYERVFLDETRAGAELFAVSTNDSWFSDSAAVYMHNSQSVLRSIENDRYLVRAANTGVSSIISPTGKVIDELDALKEGYVVADVYARNTRTLYSYIGNTFVYLCILAYLSLVVIETVFKLKTRKAIKV